MSGPAPSACPSCGTPIPAGLAQCPGCRKVFGEDNRCGACHAVAGVFARGGGYTCAACGAGRERLPGTVVLGGGPASTRPSVPPGGAERPAPLAVPATAGATGRVSAALLRVFAAGSLFAGALGAALTGLLVDGAPGVALASVVGAIGLGGAVLAWRGGRAQARAAADAERAAREQAVLALAARERGVLTVTQVARALGWSPTVADAVLTGMADGTRVSVEVDDEGVVRWHFREIEAGGGPRVRVAESLADEFGTPAEEGADAASRRAGS